MNSSNAPIPVGFRFHPTDEELVGYYLHGKVGRAQRDQLIQELDLYKLEPWDLHEVCRIGDDAAENQSNWYFFSHKDKKYPTGNRANRATTAGFWKATGRDKPIRTRRHIIGMRKTLVFYRGRAPHGQKTDWIMHEFRLDEGPSVVPNYESDGWVVCRVFRKTKSFKTKSQDTSCSFEDDHRHVGSAVDQLLAENINFMSSPVAANLHHHFNFTCKQEISVNDYGTPIPDPPFTNVDSNLQHLHDELHRNIIIQGTAITGHPPLGPRSTSSSALIRSCLQQACRPKLDHDQHSVAPAAVHGDDARSSLTEEAAAGSCSFPLNVELADYWMLEGARDNIVQRLHSGGVRRDQALADVTCHIQIKRQASDQLSVSHENLVHLWN